LKPDPTRNAIGLVEFASVAAGYVAQDAMLKAASVSLLLARTICSGKYLVVIAGDVAAVDAAVAAGAAHASGALLEQCSIARVHPAVFPAIAGTVELAPGEARALGILETFSAASIIAAADAAAKAADVTLLRIHLAMALGGKGFALMTGDVASVEAGIAAGCAVAEKDGVLAGRGVIPAPGPELFQEFL
jgi:microcompartment protein CcmL/EutN